MSLLFLTILQETQDRLKLGGESIKDFTREIVLQVGHLPCVLQAHI